MRINKFSRNFYCSLIIIVSFFIVIGFSQAQTPNTVNLAFNKPVTASTSASTAVNASYAVDGNTNTRWQSVDNDQEWIFVDLGQTYNISRVVLNWEAAYASAYKVQVSDDALTWSDIYATTSGDGGVDDLSPAGNGRYIRVYITARGTQWGASLWELEVYGKAPSTLIPDVVNLALNQSVTASTGVNASYAVDGNTNTRWQSADSDQEWIFVDLGQIYNISKIVLNWETAYASAYKIQVSDDALTWSDIYITATGDGGIDDLSLSGNGRYVRVYITARSTQWGASLWELEVYASANLALNKTVSASTSASSVVDASYAVDGNTNTRWQSADSDPEWISVDLGQGYNISRVVLNWETAYASAYKIQVSDDALTWSDIYITATGDGGTDDLLLAGSGRYLRVYITARGTQWGASLWELEVYAPANLSLAKPITASTGVNASYAVDGNTNTRWQSADSDQEWIFVDLGQIYNISKIVLNWETAYASAYKIQVSGDALTWSDIYSTATGDGGIDDLSLAGSGRYVRIYITARGTQWGASLWEFEVYGSSPVTLIPSIVNLAWGHPVTASTGVNASYIVDGNTNTRWQSANSDQEWIFVDLGQSYNISRVVLNWEAAYASAYKVQVSDDALTWSDIYATTSGDGGIDGLALTGSGRYVRIYITARGTPWGASLWEFEVYGGSSTTLGNWDFNEGNGSIAIDSSGNGNYSTLLNGASWSTGKAGSAILLDGDNDYCSIKDNPSLRFGTSDFTISTWIKHDSNLDGIDRGIYAKGVAGSGEFGLYIHAGDSKLRFIREGSVILAGNKVVADDTWHHVVATRNGTELKLYVDGVLDNTDSNYFNGINLNSLAAVEIGHLGWIRYFKGSIDEVAIYSSALSQAEIEDLYSHGIEIASQQLKLVFEDESHGMGLLRAEDINNQASFLVSADAAPLLWQIELTKVGSNQIATVVDNRTPALCQIQKISETELQLNWSAIRAGNDNNVLSVELTVSFNQDGQSEWLLKPQLHHADYTFGSLVFPCIEGAINPEHEKILFPVGNNGSRIVSQPISGTYPSYQAQLQFFGIFGNGGGLYMGLHDGNAAIKFFELNESMRLLVRNYGMDTSVAINSRCPEYPVVIAVAKTPWECCGIYREWVSTQTWTQRGKRITRTNMPPNAHNIGLWLNSNGDPAPIAAGALNEAQLQQYPTAIHWYCWMVHPFDNNYPEFFPAKLGFQDAVNQMRAADMFVVPYLNGRLWDTQLTSFDSVRPEACSYIDGSTMIENYGSGTTLGVMCPSSPTYRNKLLTAITTLVDGHNVNGIYIDQIASAAPAMCYNPNHGHPLGGGGWWQQKYRELMEPIVVNHGEKALFVSENAAEPYIDSFDTFLLWVEVYTDDFPSLMAVYNQYAWYMCSPTLPEDNLQSFAGLMSRCLLWNIQPGWLSWLHGTNADPNVADAQFKRSYIDRVVNLRHQAQEVMADGVLVDDLQLDGPVEELTLYYTRNGNYGKTAVVPGTFPSHYGTVWRSWDNVWMMVAVSELSGNQRTCSFVLAPEQYQVESTGKAIYRVFEDGSTQLVGNPGQQISVNLSAYDLQLYILK